LRVARHATVEQTLRFESALLEERRFLSLTFAPRSPCAIESAQNAVYHFRWARAASREKYVDFAFLWVLIQKCRPPSQRSGTISGMSKINFWIAITLFFGGCAVNAGVAIGQT
jgi:hypothetical protein